MPDELPRLQEALISEIKKGDKDHVVLFFLKEQLSQMLSTIETNLDVKNTRTVD